MNLSSGLKHWLPCKYVWEVKSLAYWHSPTTTYFNCFHQQFSFWRTMAVATECPTKSYNLVELVLPKEMAFNEKWNFQITCKLSLMLVKYVPTHASSWVQGLLLHKHPPSNSLPPHQHFLLTLTTEVMVDAAKDQSRRCISASRGQRTKDRQFYCLNESELPSRPLATIRTIDLRSLFPLPE